METFLNSWKNKTSVTKFFLFLIFITLVILPLLRMLWNIDTESFRNVIYAENFSEIFSNSVIATSVATFLTLIVAYFLAFSVERTNIKGKGIISILVVLPMLIPSIAHGMGLIVMFGNNGILTKLLGLEGNIYGLTGIVVGSLLYAFPVAFLMFDDVLKYQDCTPYQAARVLGIPEWRQFTAITLPYLRKPLISITLAIFTMIITDYGVPLMVGGKYKTIPVTLYQEVIGQLDFSKGSVYGIFLLLPAVVGFMFDFFNKDKGNHTYVTGKYPITKNKIRDFFAYVYSSLMILVATLPVIVFVILAFSKKYPVNLAFTLENIERTLRLRAGTYLINSVEISLFTAFIGIVLAFSTAYITVRMQTRNAKMLHLFSITSAAIPGVVLGLAYILLFKGTVFYGTIAILIMVNIMHFFASPYLMMYNSFSKMNNNLEAVGATLGISRYRIIKDVIIPQSISTIMEMFTYFFVNSMMTISAVAFLSTTANKPVSLLINQFEAQSQLECAGVVSIAILVVNLTVKAGIYLYKHFADKNYVRV